MTKRKIIQKTRKWHRYLGLILGIQFFLWTIGGLYFSWTNIDEIRGDNLKNEKIALPSNLKYISPSNFLSDILLETDSLISIRLTSILDRPYYQVLYNSKKSKNVKLIDALSGKTRHPLNQDEAEKIALERLKVGAKIVETAYLTETGNHHEYRGRPLPAYAITFDAPANTTVYVSQEYGNVQTFRNNQWRVFDFFWMLHTMDYQERDNFNNWLLRAFSIFGIFTILSGFSLYFLTSKKFNSPKK